MPPIEFGRDQESPTPGLRTNNNAVSPASRDPNGALNVNVPLWMILTPVFIMDAVIVGALLYSIRTGDWSDIARDHPGVFGPMDITGRVAWAMGIGMMNTGACFRIWGDGKHLHFAPAVLGRLIGLPSASIPWEAIELTEKGKLLKQVRVGRKTLRLPKWALETGPN